MLQTNCLCRHVSTSLYLSLMIVAPSGINSWCIMPYKLNKAPITIFLFEWSWHFSVLKLLKILGNNRHMFMASTLNF
jgi:hypothetical protein